MVQIVFRPKHLQQMLGVSERTYYRIVEKGVLPYTRLYEGGPRVHLPCHVDQYLEYLKKQSRTKQELKRQNK